jgi:hypothetical protein
MKDKNHEILNKFVEVKRAEPREARGPGGGGGGGRDSGPRDNPYPNAPPMNMYPGPSRFPGMYGGGAMRGYGYGGYGRAGYGGYGNMGYYTGGFPPYG